MPYSIIVLLCVAFVVVVSALKSEKQLSHRLAKRLLMQALLSDEAPSV